MERLTNPDRRASRYRRYRYLLLSHRWPWSCGLDVKTGRISWVKDASDATEGLVDDFAVFPEGGAQDAGGILAVGLDLEMHGENRYVWLLNIKNNLL
jgi:hypothetical protein